MNALVLLNLEEIIIARRKNTQFKIAKSQSDHKKMISPKPFSLEAEKKNSNKDGANIF